MFNRVNQKILYTHKKKILITSKGRMFSTSSSSILTSNIEKNLLLTESNKSIIFSDADKDKLEIIHQIKGKSGIYM